MAVRRKDFFSPPTYKDANSVGHENEMWFPLKFFGAGIGERPFLEWKDGFFFLRLSTLGVTRGPANGRDITVRNLFV